MRWLLSPTTVWDLVDQRATATPDAEALYDEYFSAVDAPQVELNEMTSA